MNNKYLLIDCHFLCYRALYSSGGLSHQDVQTGVVYGFLRDLLTLQQFHRTNKFIFCFDYGAPLRKKMYPEYKANRRKDQTEEEQQIHEEMLRQINLLRTVYLEQIGFKNVLSAKGYEADDIIANLVRRCTDQKCVIVSADHDMFQLLRPNITMFNPNKKQTYTHRYVKQEHLIDTKKWALVKAIAGCSSDNVQGVVGVGEKTAIKYLTGDLKPTTKAHQKIESEEGKKIAARNIKLTLLPLKGTPSFRIRKNKFSVKGWRDLMKELGINTQKGHMPKHNPFDNIVHGVRRR